MVGAFVGAVVGVVVGFVVLWVELLLGAVSSALLPPRQAVSKLIVRTKHNAVIANFFMLLPPVVRLHR